MFTKKVSNFLNELMNRGYQLKIENDEFTEESTKNEGRLKVTAKDHLSKKEYVIRISVVFVDGKQKEFIYDFRPTTDINAIKENWFIANGVTSDKKENYHFETEYNYEDTKLNVNYKISDESDPFNFDNKEVICEDIESIDVTDILNILKNNFELTNLQFIR